MNWIYNALKETLHIITLDLAITRNSSTFDFLSGREVE